jgi:hypothetical protein
MGQVRQAPARRHSDPLIKTRAPANASFGRRRDPVTPVKSSRAMSAVGTSVWTGRALQVEYDGLEIIGLAHLYSAL